MTQLSQDDLYDKAMQTVGAVARLPIVRVDREEFLRKQFAGSAHLDKIIADGPQTVYSSEALQKRARVIVRSTTMRTASVSFATGMPANLFVAVPAGAADVASYFGFAINMAQQLAYLFGEDELFDGGADEITDEAKIRIVAYLGAMFGASGASVLVNQLSAEAGKNLGRKVATSGLMQTAWYPLLRKVGAVVGKNVTTKTVEKTITKTVPVIGGAVSGGLTFVTFRPMGYRLADTLAAGLRRIDDEYDDLSPEFRAMLGDDTGRVDGDLI